MADGVTDRLVVRRTLRIIALVVLSCVLGGSVAEAQTTPRYRLIDTDTVTTAQLARAAREGYRVAPGATVAPGFLVLEHTGDKRDYLVADALLQDAARGRIPPGFRILPRTVRAFAYSRHGDSRCAAILERSPDDTRRRDYRVDRSVQHRTLLTSILNGAAAGYRPLVVASGRLGSCVVLERERPASRDIIRTEERAFVLIGASKTKRPETEYQDAVANGYRLHSKIVGELIYLMQKQDAQVPPADSVMLSHIRADTLQREMNDMAARGYRMHPYSIGISDTLPDAVGPAQVHAVMEKRSSPPIEYRVIGRWALPTMFKREFVTAGEEGWELVATLGSGLIIMQRPASAVRARNQ